MPSFGIYTVTGAGSQDLGSSQPLIYVNTWVSTLGTAEVESSVPVNRLFKAGWWALGSFGGLFPSGPQAVFFWKYLDFESESHVFANNGGSPLNARMLFYHLGQGVTCQFFMST